MATSVNVSTPTEPTVATPTVATPSPSTTEEAGKRGLTISTTVGVGVGVAAVVVIIFAVAFICVRRQRRKWGQKRKEQGEPEIKGDTPDEEILKKVKSDEGSVDAVEIGGGQMRRAELAGADEEDWVEKKDGRPVKEMFAEGNMIELAAQETPVEIGGSGVIAELDGTGIARKDTTKERKEGSEVVQKPSEIKVSKPE